MDYLAPARPEFERTAVETPFRVRERVGVVLGFELLDRSIWPDWGLR